MDEKAYTLPTTPEINVGKQFLCFTQYVHYRNLVWHGLILIRADLSCSTQLTQH